MEEEKKAPDRFVVYVPEGDRLFEDEVVEHLEEVSSYLGPTAAKPQLAADPVTAALTGVGLVFQCATTSAIVIGTLLQLKAHRAAEAKAREVRIGLPDGESISLDEADAEKLRRLLQLPDKDA